MAITYTKDIPDFTTKVKQITDITELETTVSQLSASLVTTQGAVTELETTVGQLSASMLDVQGDVATLAGAVTELTTDVNSFDDTTFSDVVTLGTIGQNRISKKGKTAVGVLNTWGSATFTENQVIAKIPADISPITYNYGVCGYTIDNVKYTAPISIVNGEITAPSPGTYTNLYLVTTILCN